MRLKTTIVLFLIALLTQCGPRQDQLRDNGMNVLYHVNGTIKSQGNKLNGLEDGEWTYYYDNGNPEAKIFYRNGKSEGTASYYYESGKIESTTRWISGIEHGEAFHYYENGQVKDHGFYKDGRQDNKFTFYAESGNIDNIQYFDNGEKEREEVFHSTKKYKVLDFFHKLGTDSTELVIYYASGKKYADVVQVGSEFPSAIFYYENGAIKGELKNSS